jgi:hypothetical protein
MIELRYLTRKLPVYNKDYPGDASETVLQYRTLEPHPHGWHPDEWSEWIDVPTVDE